MQTQLTFTQYAISYVYISLGYTGLALTFLTAVCETSDVYCENQCCTL